MSRTSIRTFLVAAKRQLQQTLSEKGRASFVIGNESADLDSITCALVYGYLQSSKPDNKRTGRLLIPITNIPASDLPLRPELTALLQHADIKPSDLITLDDLGADPLPSENTCWTLVDHNAFQGQLGKLYESRVYAVIDHHEDERKVPADASPRIVETSGSCNSLIVNHFRDIWDSVTSSATSSGAANGQGDEVTDDAAGASTWDAQVAKLSLGAILIDTADMEDLSKVTDHDCKAVQYLEAKINSSAVCDQGFDQNSFYNEISTAKANLDDLSIDDILRKDYKQWTEEGLTLGTAAVVQPIQYLRAKGENLEDVMREFARQRSLQLMALMTAYTDDVGNFARQLLLIALEDGKAKEVAERFKGSVSGELDLEDIKGDVGPSSESQKSVFEHAWDQNNPAASRKKVAPLLRQAMREKASL